MSENLFHVTELHLDSVGQCTLRNTVYSEVGQQSRVDYTGSFESISDVDYKLNITRKRKEGGVTSTFEY